MLNQLKKAQGETNERLDAIVKELQDQNRWLAHLAELLKDRVPTSSA